MPVSSSYIYVTSCRWTTYISGSIEYIQKMGVKTTPKRDKWRKGQESHEVRNLSGDTLLQELFSLAIIIDYLLDLGLPDHGSSCDETDQLDHEMYLSKVIQKLTTVALCLFLEAVTQVVQVKAVGKLF